MVRMVSAREIVGKRIVAFEANTTYEGSRGACHDPVITLDDGSKLLFVTEEKDADYGTLIIRHIPRRPTTKEPT